jgi:Sulfotransferase family
MPPRFFYVHVQKTGGTELRERLKRHFAAPAMYPDKTDGDLFTVAPQVSVGQLLRRWEQRQDQIEIITGHFPYSTIELLDADFVTLTVLREPVERTLSHLRHHRKMTPEARDMSLEAIYDEVFHRVFFHNHMVKMFSLTRDEIALSAEQNTWAVLRPIEFTPERLARAKEQLARVDVLGLQDHFDEFCDELTARFGWGLGDPLYANRTPGEDVSESLRERIAADNALDVELFDYACELYAGRVATSPDS